MRFPHKAERVSLTLHHKVVSPSKFNRMSCNNNNNVGIPVGFRFHPTDEELVGCYLYGRITTPPPDPREEDPRIIRELDLYRHEPWDLSEVCKIPGDHSANQNNWYFFSHKDKKYPTGNRANRATKAGFWKATGRDKCIQTRGAVGMRKTLVFYRGRAPHGQKTEWIMHEFRLDVDYGNQLGNHLLTNSSRASSGYDHEGADAWVVCRVFRKTKNLKSKGDCSNDTPTTSVEEDHQLALLPEITDSTEKFSSDEGEHVDCNPPAPDHMAAPPHHFNNANYCHLQQQQQHCKQELLSVNDYAHAHMNHHHHQDHHAAVVMVPPEQQAASTTVSMFRTSASPNYNTFLDSAATAFEHQIGNQIRNQMMTQMGGSGGAVAASSSTAAGLFSPLPNNPYLAMLEENLPRADMSRGLTYRSCGPAMLDGLEDFRFGNPALPSSLDQSLTDVVTRPLERLQQLQQAGELLSSTPSQETVSFGMPWTARSQFADFCNGSDVDTTFLSSEDHQH